MRRIDLILTLLVLTTWPVIPPMAADGISAVPAGSLDAVPPWAAGTGVVIGMLGGPVFAIWYAWYITTNRIPVIERAHAEQLANARELFAAQLTAIVTNNREDMRALWATKREDERSIAMLRREDDGKLIAVLERLSERIEDHSCKFTGAPHGS